MLPASLPALFRSHFLLRSRGERVMQRVEAVFRLYSLKQRENRSPTRTLTGSGRQAPIPLRSAPEAGPGACMTSAWRGPAPAGSDRPSAAPNRWQDLVLADRRKKNFRCCSWRAACRFRIPTLNHAQSLGPPDRTTKSTGFFRCRWREYFLPPPGGAQSLDDPPASTTPGQRLRTTTGGRCRDILEASLSNRRSGLSIP